MEKQTLTFADQEIANRLANRKHFLKDVDQLIGWKAACFQYHVPVVLLFEYGESGSGSFHDLSLAWQVSRKENLREAASGDQS